VEIQPQTAAAAAAVLVLLVLLARDLSAALVVQVQPVQ
jgi:hypothetical protein